MSLLWEVRPSPGKGFGVFATRRIPKYARVLVEAPQFVIVPPEYDVESFSSSSASAGRFTDMYSRVSAAFSDLSAAEQAIYLDCHEHRFPGEPESGRLFYIFRSNAYDIVPVDASIRPRHGTVRWGMFPRMARINHSCRPNVAHLWVPADETPGGGTEEEVPAKRRDRVRGHHVVWATRDIASGEELFISYINLLQDKTSRQRSLRQYGFECECSVCEGIHNVKEQNNTSVHARRMRAGELLRAIQDALTEIEDAISFNGDAIMGSLDQADVLLRILKNEDDEESGSHQHTRHENGGLAGYLPRAYHLAVELGRLATRNGAAAPDGRYRMWAAEEEALRRLLSGDV